MLSLLHIESIAVIESADISFDGGVTVLTGETGAGKSFVSDARGAVLWAKAGLATAILPASMSSLCAGLDIREIDEKALETQILLIWRKGKKPLPAVQDFIAVCRGESGLSTPL